METLNRAGRNRRLLRFIFVLLAVTAALACVSCGSKLIKGRPPFVSVSAMNLDGGDLVTRFDIANQNGVAMNIEATEITVSVRDSELTRYDSREPLEIDANSAEAVTARLEPDDFTLTLLRSLDSGELDSLSIAIVGRVHTLEDGFLRFDQEGYLYRVPGRPGQFRSAVTQAKGLVREDPR